ncbi:hypothetical protein GJAV_G00221770, partial [Gymnothorax javanicus]
SSDLLQEVASGRTWIKIISIHWGTGSATPETIIDCSPLGCFGDLRLPCGSRDVSCLSNRDQPTEWTERGQGPLSPCRHLTFSSQSSFAYEESAAHVLISDGSRSDESGSRNYSDPPTRPASETHNHLLCFRSHKGVCAPPPKLQPHPKNTKRIQSGGLHQ